MVPTHTFQQGREGKGRMSSRGFLLLGNRQPLSVLPRSQLGLDNSTSVRLTVIDYNPWRSFWGAMMSCIDAAYAYTVRSEVKWSEAGVDMFPLCLLLGPNSYSGAAREKLRRWTMWLQTNMLELDDLGDVCAFSCRLIEWLYVINGEFHLWRDLKKGEKTETCGFSFA